MASSSHELDPRDAGMAAGAGYAGAQMQRHMACGGMPAGRAGVSGPPQQLAGSGGVIGQLVATTSREHLAALVQQTRAFLTTQPQQARQLLLSQPQLFVALRLALDRLYTPPSCDYAPGSYAASAQPRRQMVPLAHPSAYNPYGAPRGGCAPSAAQPTPAARPAGLDEHQRVLLEQVRGLTPEQLATLSPVERQQIEMLKAASMAF
jgi:hypothetical protein